MLFDNWYVMLIYVLHVFFWLTCVVMLGLYVDWSSSAVVHICAMWHPYLFKSIMAVW